MKRSFERKIALLLCAVMLSSAILTSCGSLFGRQEESTEGTSAPSSSETEDKTPDSTESGNGSGDIGESGDGHVHNYDYSGVVTPPTCTAKGYTTYTCECGHSYTVEDPTIPAHTPVIDERVEPTFTSSGLTEGSHCGVCYEILVPQVKIPKKVATATLTSPTFEVNGYKISGRVPYATEWINLAEYIFLSPDVTWQIYSGWERPETQDTEEIRDVVPPYETEGVILPGGTPEYSEDIDIPDEPETEIEPIDTAIEPIETEIGADFYEVPVETEPADYSEDIYIEPDDYPDDYTYTIPEQTYDFIETESFTETESLPDETTEDYPPIIIDPPMIDPFPEDNKTVYLYQGNNPLTIYVINPDGITTYYTLNIYRNHLYTVAFDANGGSEVDIQYVEEGHLATAPTTEREGYTLTSWDYDFTKPVKNDLTVTANWIANENTAYTVEYYLENIAKDGYTLVETDILEGATDTPVYAVKKNFEHFTLNSDISVPGGNVTGDGSLVLKLFYTRKEYNVTALAGNTQGGTVTLAEKTTNPETDSVSSAYAYESEVTLSATTNAGYTFLGWFNGDTKLTDDPVYTFTAQGSVICSARWLANTDVAYRVEYYLQNVEQNGYELIEGETVLRERITDTTAEADLKSFEHFTLDTQNSILSGKITGEGALALKLYYTRDTYTVSASGNNEKGGAVIGTGEYAYGKEITLSATTNAGYTFLGWFDGQEKLSDSPRYTFTVESDLSYTARWEANGDVAYTVEYYLENENKNGYYLAVDETLNLFGVADTQARAEVKEFEHFTLNTVNSILSGNINGDGSLVLKVYYTRDAFTVTCEDASVGTVNITDEIGYGNQITVYLTSISIGYDFIGWYSEEGELLSADSQYTFIVEYNVVARFATTAAMQGFSFTSTSDTCVIDGIVDKTVSEVIIPSYVTGIGQGAFAGCENLVSVVFEENSQLQDVADGAFEGCSALSDITLPSTVTSISNRAFSGCTSLATIGIPSSVTSVGECAFDGCINLASVTFAGSRVASIGSFAFRNCVSLTKISIPYYVKTIGEGAFYGCDKLANVTISQYGQLQAVGDYAFYGCSSLTKINTSYYTVSIGDYAFYGCVKLANANFNQSTRLVSIGEGAFSGCAALTSFSVTSNLKTVGDRAFENCTTLANVTLPDTLESIGERAFANCSALSDITLSENLKSIGDGAFANCSQLAGISLYENLESIGEGAFENCTALESITLQGNLTSIGDRAFANCILLTEVVVPASVTSIGEGVFALCPGIESITLPFIGSSLKTANDTYQYPLGYLFGTESYEGSVATLQYFYGSSPASTTQRTYYIPEALKSVTVTGGNILSGAFYGCGGIENITLGEGVNSIAYAAFYGCSSIANLTLPFVGDSVKTERSAYQYPLGYIFGSEAYEGSVATLQYYHGTDVNDITCTAYYIPASLKNLTVLGGNLLFGALYGCGGIEQVTLGANVTTVVAGAFYGCSSLSHISAHSNNRNFLSLNGNLHNGDATTLIQYAIGKSALSFAVPQGVTTIGPYAFACCESLESISIPTSVTNIAQNAFENCPNLIEAVDGVSYADLWVVGFDNSTASVTLREGTRGIAEGAFENADNLTNIIIPFSVEVIGFGAFRGCSGLARITLPFVGAKKSGNANTHFGYIFGAEDSSENGDCVPQSLKTVIITDSESIGSSAFNGCDSIENIAIPDSITSIDTSAFTGCNSLKGVYINSIDAWCRINFADYQSNPLTYAKKLYLGYELITDLYIPYGVESIGKYTFYNCYSLESVTIPSTVTSISDFAFYGCWKLSNLDIPYGVESIGYEAFYGCQSLKNIVVPDSVTFIDEYAFAKCFALESISLSGNIDLIALGLFLDCVSIREVTIPDGVTSIGNNAFKNCSKMSSVTIPSSVTLIGSSAFADCESLVSINYSGYLDEWDEIFKYYSWDIGALEYIVYCYDGTIK